MLFEQLERDAIVLGAITSLPAGRLLRARPNGLFAQRAARSIFAAHNMLMNARDLSTSSLAGWLAGTRWPRPRPHGARILYSGDLCAPHLSSRADCGARQGPDGARMRRALQAAPHWRARARVIMKTTTAAGGARDRWPPSERLSGPPSQPASRPASQRACEKSPARAASRSRAMHRSALIDHAS